MTAYRWLHLTDLHLGMSGQAPLWPNMEQVFLDDLDFLRREVGPWDLVLFTGDLTQRGTDKEFDAFERLLKKLWSRFADWGFEPKLLAIPGNHDLVRPVDPSDPALVTLRRGWKYPEVQAAFWEQPDYPSRVLVSSAFGGFTRWWAKTSIPKPPTVQDGLLPGDWSASIDAGGFKLGVLGLNSAYLQLAEGDFEGRLHLDVRQFHGACGGQGPDWIARHDVNLLLTHHPVAWLSPEARQHFADEIHAPPQRFALHLFGHRHEANLTSIAQGGGAERRGLQGCSLFGMETWGDQQQRVHGYSLGELKVTNGELRLRTWPRLAVPKQGGGRELDRDTSFDCDKRDGGTHPIVVARLTEPPTPPPQGSRSELAGSVPPRPVADYDPRKPVFYVPYREKGDQVIGRAQALERVREQLLLGRRTAIGQTAVFQGLGGLGKTQLAVEYAYRYRGDYPNGVIWLTADQDLDAQLVELAVRARWVAPESEHAYKLAAARRRLRSVSDCLIVFDNLEDAASIRDYLPEPPASPHVLVTSRGEQPDFISVPIDLLDADQSLRMLVREASREPQGDTESDAARAIAAELDGLPLALELAGAYLARRPVAFQSYLELLRHNLRKALPGRIASLTKHEADLYSTLQISEGALADEPCLQPVLDVLTWSGPASMGIDLLAVLVGVEDQAELIGALGLGTALRVLQQVPGTERYALHRLVREVRREQVPLSARPDWAAECCARIDQWFTTLTDDFLNLPRFEAEIDHLREWHTHALDFAPGLAPRLTWLQVYPPIHRGQPQEVLRCIERALDEYRQQDCGDRELLANMYNDQAGALRELGDPQRALELSEEALSIRRGLFGDGHRDTARSLNNIAAYIGDLGDPRRALELSEQALVIRRDLFGERHPDTATSLNNIAGYTGELGDPRRAQELSEQALAIQRDLFGERHPDTAMSLSNIAYYTDELGHPKRALELADQALAIRRELFGVRHPDIALSLHSTASYLLDLHRPKEAHARAKEAYNMRRQLLGAEHPDTLIIQRLLARMPGFRAPSKKKSGGKKGRKRRK